MSYTAVIITSHVGDKFGCQDLLYWLVALFQVIDITNPAAVVQVAVKTKELIYGVSMSTPNRFA